VPVLFVYTSHAKTLLKLIRKQIVPIRQQTVSFEEGVSLASTLIKHTRTS